MTISVAGSSVRIKNPDKRSALVRFFRRVQRYNEFAMLLHWLVAAGIAFLFIHGFLMMH